MKPVQRHHAERLLVQRCANAYLNPIKMAWTKAKYFLQKVQARTKSGNAISTL
ncbi:hypothetical protein NOC27_3296 [Nitrosococcus oceani AFC27]|nr:hypothetical protein NOC27_3296 [Nitrosococcus oceani AFC27]